MNDEDINKLAVRLTETLATKKEFKQFEAKIDEVNIRADQILEYAMSMEEVTTDHEKRISNIESIPPVS